MASTLAISAALITVRDVEIALRQLRRADADGFVGEADVKRVAVSFAVDGYGADAQFLAGTNHPQGNLSAIRNQDFLEHWVDRCGKDHVGTAALGCPAEQRSAILIPGKAVERGSTGQPRAAVPTRLLSGANGKQLLPVFDGRVIRDQFFHDLAGHVRLDFVHQLHGFHNAENLTRLHHVAGFHKWRRAGRGRFVERADDGRMDDVYPFFWRAERRRPPEEARPVGWRLRAMSPVPEKERARGVR